MVLRFETEDLGGNMLNRVQQFAVAGQQEGSIGAGEFDRDLGGASGGEEVCGETAGGAPAASLEFGCTWPLQARMWDFRLRPPVVLRVSRNSLIFLVAWPGSYKAFVIVICKGTTLCSLSLHSQCPFGISYIKNRRFGRN